jgi:hypothetical protein
MKLLANIYTRTSLHLASLIQGSPAEELKVDL